ncbi:putative sugar kinase YdjH [termite gut metagenome]|uniref:Putative sugar kinase YdjH n=1 Tax=termite gut metagenome TaxID=433724 RepID=A0A5J4S589_9ZZZZ
MKYAISLSKKIKNVKMDKIIGIGNALIDVLVPIQNDTILQEMDLPKGSMQLIDASQRKQMNESISRMNTQLATGGAAANTILGLACLGVATGFIGKIGKDEYGTFYRKNLQENKIEDKLFTSNLSSGVATTFVSPDGERTFGTYLGAASTLKAEDLTLDMFKGYTYLFIEGYLVQDHGMILHAIELAKEAGLQICLDMASYNVVEEDKEFFFLLIKKYVDIVFANEDEAKALTGKGAEEALEIMARMCSVAVVKVGADGSYIQKGTKKIKIEALPIKEVTDTTGAGDYYAAGFLYGLTCGYPLEKCGKIGAILSGNVIQVIGTTLPKPKWDKIKLKINEILE